MNVIEKTNHNRLQSDYMYIKRNENKLNKKRIIVLIICLLLGQ